MYTNIVYHEKFGEGKIIGDGIGKIEVQFEDKIRGFSPSAWGKNIFKSKEAMEENRQNKLEKRLKEKNDEDMKRQREIDKNRVFDFEYDEKTMYSLKHLRQFNSIWFDEDDEKSLDEQFLIKLGCRTLRKIVIACIKEKNIRGKKYLNIIGIDILTGIMVKIVDTNGAEYGFHSFKDEFLKLKRDDVIEAEFKEFYSKSYLNVLRIVSAFMVKGTCNIRNLNKKYKEIQAANIFRNGFVWNFHTIFELARQHPKEEFYVITNFTGSKVHEYVRVSGEKKYQLKMDNIFVDIEESMNWNEVKEKYFIGKSIISVIQNIEHPIIKACRLMGKFVTEERYKYIKKIRNMKTQSHYLDISIEDMEDIEDMGDIEYDQQFPLQMNECIYFFTEQDYYEALKNETYFEPMEECDDEYFEAIEEEYGDYYVEQEYEYDSYEPYVEENYGSNW